MIQDNHMYLFRDEQLLEVQHTSGRLKTTLNIGDVLFRTPTPGYPRFILLRMGPSESPPSKIHTWNIWGEEKDIAYYKTLLLLQS